MPFARAGDVEIHYEIEGDGGAPVLVLAHPLGTDLSVWEPQRDALARRFRLLRYDARGHGRSSVTPGPYTIEQLGRDVVALLDALSIEHAHFCGLSIGGLVGIWLGAHAAPRLRRLVLSNTATRIGSVESWNTRIDAVRKDGLRGLAPAMMERWFTGAFRASRPETVAKAQAMLSSCPPEGYIACCAAIRDADLDEAARAIRVPALVISGRSDPATPPAQGRALAGTIAGARYVELEASHLSSVEAAAAYTDEVVRFLTA
jgi:3-oxoadipate enol-lactonase